MKYNFLLKGLICVIVLGLAGCQTTQSQKVEKPQKAKRSHVIVIDSSKMPKKYDDDLTIYSPATDVEGQGKTQAAYDTDIEACRELGIKMHAEYKDAASIAVQQQVHKSMSLSLLGRPATKEELEEVSGGSGEYNKDIAEFGPTIIVDRCMEQNGWQLSAK